MPKIKKPTLPLNYKAALLKIIYLLCSKLLQFPPRLFLNHNILQHWGSWETTIQPILFWEIKILHLLFCLLSLRQDSNEQEQHTLVRNSILTLTTRISVELLDSSVRQLRTDTHCSICRAQLRQETSNEQRKERGQGTRVPCYACTCLTLWPPAVVS